MKLPAKIAKKNLKRFFTGVFVKSIVPILTKSFMIDPPKL